MPQAFATITTTHGAKYMQQLCKHWSHKLETECDGARGRVNFGTAAAHFTAAPEALAVTIAAPDSATLDRLEPVVAEHLQRFAFREQLVVAWTRATD